MVGIRAATAGLVLSLAGVSLAWAADGPEISYNEQVRMNVGESQVLYGYRGDCGERPELGSVRVPSTSTGSFSFGRMGWRPSRSCGGSTPAVELVFTATSPGTERIKIQGDPIQITVSD